MFPIDDCFVVNCTPPPSVWSLSNVELNVIHATRNYTKMERVRKTFIAACAYTYTHKSFEATFLFIKIEIDWNLINILAINEKLILIGNNWQRHTCTGKWWIHNGRGWKSSFANSRINLNSIEKWKSRLTIAHIDTSTASFPSNSTIHAKSQLLFINRREREMKSPFVAALQKHWLLWKTICESLYGNGKNHAHFNFDFEYYAIIIIQWMP